MFSVMIVDNEAVIRKGLSKCIEWEAHNCEIVAQASDGLDALDKMKRCRVDILITDIRMPGMSGLELAKEVYKQYPRTKIIILTGYPEFTYAQQAIHYRIADFIVKPTSAEKLIEAVTCAKNLLQEDRRKEETKKILEDRESMNLYLQQQLFLSDLMHGKNLSTLYIHERSNMLDLPLSGYYIIETLLNSHSQDGHQLLEYMQEAQKYMRLSLKEYPHYFIARSDERFDMVLLTDEEIQLRPMLHEAVEMIENMTEFVVAVGVSEFAKGGVQVMETTRQAEDAMQYASYATESQVAYYSDIPKLSKENQKEMIHILKELTAAIENQRMSDIQRMVSAFTMFLQRAHIPFVEVKNSVLLLYNFCTTMWMNYNLENFISSECRMSSDVFLRDLTLDTMEERMYQMINQTMQGMKENLMEIDGIVRYITSYILQNYKENMSLELLAGLVHLSPSYLSKLFKKHMGQNISTYIQSVRVDRAKMLMKNTSLKTYEIAEAVGIDDPIYFSRMFKKATGMKPKDYKKEQAEKEAASL